MDLTNRSPESQAMAPSEVAQSNLQARRIPPCALLLSLEAAAMWWSLSEDESSSIGGSI